jgi:glycerol-3-phosphate dehydrogenase (NAD(P)+)
MQTNFAILGDGAWGTAIALLLAQHPRHHVRLWSARAENARLLKKHRENIHLLPGVRIPEAIDLTMDAADVADADVWVSAIPTVYLRPVLTRLREELGGAERRPAPLVISLTKGIEIGTFLRPSEILAEVLGAQHIVVLSGPSHAEEVSRGMPTSLVAASTEQELALLVQKQFSTDRFRVYTNLDPLGVELGGALLTRGLAEMTRFGVALGAEAATFAGLAGLGDLITTCFSRHGRNRLVGERLAHGERLPDILKSMENVAEGVTTAQAVYHRACRMGIEMPITTEVYRVLYEGKNPRDAVNDLMVRSPKGER